MRPPWAAGLLGAAPLAGRKHGSCEATSGPSGTEQRASSSHPSKSAKVNMENDQRRPMAGGERNEKKQEIKGRVKK